jgi:amino-acid N-acetyltransferase
VRLDRATAGDLPAVLELLHGHRLPVDGAADHVDTMVVARQGTRVVGVAALEVYAEGALLRSVAVAPDRLGQDIGHQVTEAALALARERHIDDVFLLTTSAEGYFPRFGFAPIARGDVPPSVQASVEFQSACPASATVMRARLIRRRR